MEDTKKYPELILELIPHWDAQKESVGSMTIKAQFPADAIPDAPGSPDLVYPKEAFGGLCPFPEWTELKVADDTGVLSFEDRSVPGIYSGADFRGLFLEREPQGSLRWEVTLLPRILPEGYRSSPYYDFRAEHYGLNGSGMFSFILPAGDMQAPLRVHLSWDLSDMPEGARGIWSYGEGTVDRVLSRWQVMLTLYNTGLMHAVEEGGLGVYWFETPYFDAESVARRLYPIFDYERNYFDDPDAQFRVFLRRDPFEKSGGGSACPYAFISGYSAMGGMDADSWFNVLIHEMTHTWPSMTDFRVGEGTWFSEGATEYYCTVLPYRAGLLDADFTAARINDKITGRYYRNVYREMSNAEIPKIQWKDRRAQTVPYGRGFLYLANTEAKLRVRGLGSIDEIVKRHSIVNPMTPAQWEAFVTEKLGDEGRQDFEDMKAGKLLVPEPDLFGGEFKTVREEIELDGKMAVSYHWEASHE